MDSDNGIAMDWMMMDGITMDWIAMDLMVWWDSDSDELDSDGLVVVTVCCLDCANSGVLHDDDNNMWIGGVGSL